MHPLVDSAIFWHSAGVSRVWLRCFAATNFSVVRFISRRSTAHRKVCDGGTPSPTRGTRALPRARTREFLPVLRIAHFPAQRRNLIAEFVALFPIFFPSCLLTLLRELRHCFGNNNLRLGFETEDSVDLFPPIEPRVCGGGVKAVFIHRAVCLANR